MNKKVLYIFTFIIILIYIIQNFALAKDASLKDEESENDITNKENIVEVSYKTHVQDIGWQEWKENGELSGTEGQSKRLEGISIKINNSDSIRIKYQTHIQNIGWQNWKYDGEISGTEGENKRLEGIKIELENTEKYSIEYRAHVQDIGWQAWKKDGEMAGTEGQSLRLEAIEIKIIERKIGITYQTHIQDIGWQEWKKDGELSGTEGQGKRLEAIKIQLNSYPNLKIKYKVHVQNIGWQDWKQNGEMAGTSERSLRLEAIVMELEKSNDFSIQYRVHVENIGWQDWRNEGQIAGTSGQSLRLEGIQIRVIKKVKKARICIDTPKEILTINSPKELEISGWKMSNVSNDELQIFIDDSEKAINKDLIKYKKRQDVIDLVKEYGKEIENPLPGFSVLIETSKLETGKHTVKICDISEGVSIVKTSISFFVTKDIGISYSSHVEDFGWQDFVDSDELSGTIGKGKRIEGIKIKLANAENISIKYMAHVQDVGWQEWKENGEIAGTEGRSLRLEAIRLKLEGTEEYSILYRTYIQDIGWQNWCYDGEIAGTQGLAYILEAIEIKIVRKIQDAKARVCIDIPKDKISNKVHNVSGWIMTNKKETTLKVLIDNIELSNIQRNYRQDVINYVKGYGDNTIYNTNPGYYITIDFSNYSIGKHTITVQAIFNNKILDNQTKNFEVRNEISYYSGYYGRTGLKEVGDKKGSDLEYFKYGNGPNVFFATFAIHGFEDLWPHDGYELVEIAEKFYQTLIKNEDYDLSDKWTIYIFPAINVDGVKHGNTNNGPGRTTLKSNGEKGVDLNRCWSTNFQANYSNRNYTGSEPFMACEARYLRDFMIQNKSKNGQTVLVDLHGWTQQLIGDRDICYYYGKQFPENDGSSIERYGTGYLIGWARNTLGNNNKSAKSALIELPNNEVKGHQDVVNNKFCNRYINATLEMLKNL